MVSEHKVLAHPASVDSIPTSANQEDHNSKGSITARKHWTILDNVERVLSIELLCAVQGVDQLRPLTSSPFLETIISDLRQTVPIATEDRVLYHDMNAAYELVKSGVIVGMWEGR